MKKIVVSSDGGLFTVVVTDHGSEIESFGPYEDDAEREEYRRDWLDEGALDASSEVALKLTLRGALAIETF